MAFSHSSETRRPCGMGYIQDVGIYGAACYPSTRSWPNLNRARLRKDIEEYHITYAIDFDNTDIDTFIALRPDGLTFDKEKP